jgi:signal transduction histidine kinase
VATRTLSHDSIHEPDANADRAPVDMEALVREAWAGIEGSSAVELRLGRIPAARGDREMLARVWTILLVNAVRFCAGREGPRVEVSGGAGADYVVYGVRDNGARFQPGFMGKLFYFFERIQEEYPGTGVGLATVHRLAARHGGNTWVEARSDRGVFFQFSLPLHDVD